MPFSEDALTLDPGPGCVRQARIWVTQSLRQMGRDDLVEAAELGVAELVGNALLHARAPIRLRMRGTREHPRIEVLDGSPQLPTPSSPASSASDDEEQLTTVGRGLGIVAMTATSWGAETERGGKVVWFEPATTITEHREVAGNIVGADASRTHDAVLGETGLPVLLQRLPVPLFASYRRHHQELRRELRLLALAHGETYPIATSISRVFRSFEDQLHRASGAELLDRATEVDIDAEVDLTLVVPPELPHTASRMVDMLELADAFCRSERLLSLATSAEQRAFRQWYLGEFVRQGDGEPPTPWSADLLALATEGHDG